MRFCPLPGRTLSRLWLPTAWAPSPTTVLRLSTVRSTGGATVCGAEMVALAGAVVEMAAEMRAAAATAAVEREAETRVEGSVSGARAMAATVAVGKEAEQG